MTQNPYASTVKTSFTPEEVNAALESSMLTPEEEKRISNNNSEQSVEYDKNDVFHSDTGKTIVTGGPVYGDYLDDGYGSLEDDWSVLEFDIPDWGIEDYINERSKWIKGIGPFGREPGFFYFKVFFKFNTNFGLFGGEMNIDGTKPFTGNCAKRFLQECKLNYTSINIQDRLTALERFTVMLSKINTETPWLIKKVQGLDSVYNKKLEDNLAEERSIELVLQSESVDMKIINMLNLYKFACFDEINQKEIIPQNLRKFDMIICLYGVPIRYFQTAIMTSNKNDLKNSLSQIAPPSVSESKAVNVINKTLNFLTSKADLYQYKRMNPNNGDMSNMMSFHMMTFQNCEFDYSSFSKYMDQADFNNENPFQIEEIPITIKYDRVYTHTFNEWQQHLFGVDGFYYNGEVSEEKGGNKDMHNKRLESLLVAHNGRTFYDKSAAQYKSLIDYAESMITDGLMSLDMDKWYMYMDGNLYGDINIGSEYYENYKKVFSKGLGNLGNLYGTRVGKTDKNAFIRDRVVHTRNQVAGNIYGEDVQSLEFFYKKIKELKDGSIEGNLYPDKDGNKRSLFYKESEVKNILLKNKEKGSTMRITMPERPKWSDYVEAPKPMQQRISPSEWAYKNYNNPWKNMLNNFTDQFKWSSSGWGGK